MTPEDFKKLFALAPGRYPFTLEASYPRILANILKKWETPREEQDYLNDLVVDARGDRQGFPTQVMEELLFISAVYHRWLNDRRRKADPKRLAELSPNLVFELEAAQSKMSPALDKAQMKLRGLLTRDDPAALDFMSAQGIGVNQKDNDGMTALMHAASANAEKCVLALIKLNANPHMVDAVGNTALHWAVVMNRLRMVEILLYFGANPDHKNKAGATPFALSAIKTDPTIALRLLDYNASLVEHDGAGNTPLHKAVSARSKEGVLMLLQAGANKDIRNKQNVSAFELAQSIPEIAAVFERHRAQMMQQHAK